MKFFGLLIFSFLLFVTNKGFSQCCAAGSPSTSNGISQDGDKGILTFGISHRYSFSDTYHTGSTASNYVYYKNANYNFTNFSCSYGFTKDLSLSAEIGYFENKSFVIPIDLTTDYTIKSQGLADAMFSLNYLIFNSKKYKFSISTFERLTLPFGQFGVIQNGVVLPIDIQPSSGSLRFAQGLVLSKSLSSKFSLLSVNTFESSQRIQSANYKYGDLWNFSLAANYNFSKKFSARLQLRSMIRSHTYDFKQKESMQLINASGGKYLFLSPEIAYSFGKNWKVSCLVEIPMYQYLNGTQLANKFAAEVKLVKKFNFNKEELDSASIVFKTTFTVYGKCEMCKERIEETALDFPGVVQAFWNAETNVLYIGATENVDVEKIKKQLAKVGHDSDTQKADDKVYNKLPACCHYR